MAKLTFSVLLSDASGAAGDVVFSRWKGRPYARRRVTPANPNTANQQAQRTAFALCVASWKSLISKLQTAWGTVASTRSISGYNLFCSDNVAQERTDNWQLLTPAELTREPVTTFAAAGGMGSGTIDLTWAAGSATGTDVMTICARKLEDGTVVLATDAGTTVSSLAYTITGLTAGGSYICYAANRDASDNYAPSVYATATATA